ncbi:Protein of unknown function [Nitrosomonas aestuarii]|uniref:DUF2764 domain-containing protein n=1 Tax=Nitrosomonas aestuarii TaxID=52441 RepID=A0A1I4DYC9_9PROT|nr:DUF2764 family protein [Nitrosomonas aestuarii]SFK98602.1 Protein of unknown function [Nitrosomonas aestuarii]HNP51250.1 DUF2764 family protein [Nitrosomonas nitrosa]
MILAKQYYYLIAGLPNIEPDVDAPPLDQTTFKDVLLEQCNLQEATLLDWLLYPLDNENLVRMLHHKPAMAETGAFTSGTLDNIINRKTKPPHFMGTFLDAFWQNKEAHSENEWKNKLTTLYYRAARALDNVFLRDWMEFELRLNNLIVAINGRKHNFSYADALIPDGEFTIQLISNSKKTNFGLVDDELPVEDVIKMMETSNLLAKEKYLDDLRWRWLDERTFFYYFTIEKLLAYYIKLGMLSRWHKLDSSRGRERLYKTLTDFRQDLTFLKA